MASLNSSGDEWRTMQRTRRGAPVSSLGLDGLDDNGALESSAANLAVVAVSCGSGIIEEGISSSRTSLHEKHNPEVAAARTSRAGAKSRITFARGDPAGTRARAKGAGGRRAIAASEATRTCSVVEKVSSTTLSALRRDRTHNCRRSHSSDRTTSRTSSKDMLPHPALLPWSSVRCRCTDRTPAKGGAGSGSP
jgi:hypothetical protein